MLLSYHSLLIHTLSLGKRKFSYVIVVGMNETSLCIRLGLPKVVSQKSLLGMIQGTLTTLGEMIKDKRYHVIQRGIE